MKPALQSIPVSREVKLYNRHLVVPTSFGVILMHMTRSVMEHEHSNMAPGTTSTSKLGQFMSPHLFFLLFFYCFYCSCFAMPSLGPPA